MTVLLLPAAVTVIGFDVTGLPFPNSPIWLNGAGLHAEGRQTAVMFAEPGNSGVTDPTDGGIVCGVVELNSTASPVITFPFVSSTVAVSGWVLFSDTLMLFVPAGNPGAASVIDAGGHVDKNPAVVAADDEFDTVAVTTVEPGWLAVATPF
jgi:hypothetical protein